MSPSGISSIRFIFYEHFFPPLFSEHCQCLIVLCQKCGKQITEMTQFEGNYSKNIVNIQMMKTEIHAGLDCGSATHPLWNSLIERLFKCNMQKLNTVQNYCRLTSGMTKSAEPINSHIWHKMEQKSFSIKTL